MPTKKKKLPKLPASLVAFHKSLVGDEPGWENSYIMHAKRRSGKRVPESFDCQTTNQKFDDGIPVLKRMEEDTFYTDDLPDDFWAIGCLRGMDTLLYYFRVGGTWVSAWDEQIKRAVRFTGREKELEAAPVADEDDSEQADD